MPSSLWNENSLQRGYCLQNRQYAGGGALKLWAARGGTPRAAFSIATSAAHFVNGQFAQTFVLKHPEICATFF